MAMSPAPTKICGPAGGCEGGGVGGGGPGVGPVGDWLPQYPQATQTSDDQNASHRRGSD